MTAPGQTVSVAAPVNGSRPDGIGSTDILGVTVNTVTREQTIRIVEEMIAGRRSCQIVTVNPEFIIMARRRPDFKRLLNRAALATADGIGLVLGSRMLRTPIPERVTGVDMTQDLATLAAAKGYRIFFLGAAPGVAGECSDRLANQHPGLAVAGVHSGSPAAEEEDAICRMIRDSKAQILLVAFGTPAQEFWIERNLAKLNVPVAIGVGGTFDFIAGVVKRAPRWMRRSGLEWLYRLFLQPKRWKRMLALPEFGARVLFEGMKRR